MSRELADTVVLFEDEEDFLLSLVLVDAAIIAVVDSELFLLLPLLLDDALLLVFFESNRSTGGKAK